MTEKDNPIEWDPKYSVGIEDIDSHQKKMFELFNELVALKHAKADGKAFAGMISNINEFAKVYFSAEEKILKKKKYPDYEAHVKGHREFIKQTINLRREIAEDCDYLTLDVISELRDRLIEHIELSDSQYVPFLRIHQYIEEFNAKS